jgi:hypothetical protein
MVTDEAYGKFRYILYRPEVWNGIVELEEVG